MKTTNRCILLIGLLVWPCLLSYSQGKGKDPYHEPPKLVIGIVVDQMRYDYLFKYWDKYSDGGFKRMLKEGYNFKNHHYNYSPTYTGPGHAAIYTGTTPAYNGIIGNNWYNRELGRSVYVAEDTAVNTVGSSSNAGKMSPRNMYTTTITDELKLFSNMQSKVIGVCLKDRGSIMPAGHIPDAAYWYDGETGNWITSTYYTEVLPGWVESFNKQKLAEKYLDKPWETLLAVEEYTESFPDGYDHRQPFADNVANRFPHPLPDLKKGRGTKLLPNTPFGNTFTMDFALEALKKEKMGQRDIPYPDFLALSFSSTDYIGHQFGIQSMEIQDTYLRLDLELARLFGYIDENLGMENVLLFLTADHGAAETPGYMQSLEIPAGFFPGDRMKASVENYLKGKYGEGDWVLSYINQQIYLNHPLIKEKGLALKEVQGHCVDYLKTFKGVYEVYTATDLPFYFAGDRNIDLVRRGYHPRLSGDVIMVLDPAWFDSSYYIKGGTTHGSSYAYDTHVPLLWFGWKVKKGASSSKPVYIPDIAPTISNLLNISMPNGTTGTPIDGLLE